MPKLRLAYSSINHFTANNSCQPSTCVKSERKLGWRHRGEGIIMQITRRRLGVWVRKSVQAGVLSSFMLSATAVADDVAVGDRGVWSWTARDDWAAWALGHGARRRAA